MLSLLLTRAGWSSAGDTSSSESWGQLPPASGSFASLVSSPISSCFHHRAGIVNLQSQGTWSVSPVSTHVEDLSEPRAAVTFSLTQEAWEGAGETD